MSFTGQSFSFDGNSFDTFLKVLDWTVQSPPGDIRPIKVLGRDGAFSGPTTFDAYDLRVDCLIVGTSFANAIDNRDTLMSQIATRNAGQLIFDELSSRYYPGKFKSAAPIDRVNPEAFRISLVFFIGDPFQFAIDPATVLTLGPTSGTGSAEALATPVIAGSADTHGIWILKNNVASGGSKTITLNNKSAKTVSTHTLALNAGTGDWIRYTPASQKIELSTDSGSTWNRAPEGWDGAMPFLKFGIANQLELTSSDPITLEITYNAAYL